MAGACTVLVVTALHDPTADLVIAELYRRGVRVARFDRADMGETVTMSAGVGRGTPTHGSLVTPTRVVDLDGVQAVYWRRPSPFRFSHQESQVQAWASAEARHGLTGVLTSLPGCRYVNNPHAAWAADYKPAQLQAAVELGFTVPGTLFTNSAEQVRRFATDHEAIVYKPLRTTNYSIDGAPQVIWVDTIDPSSVDDSIGATMHQFQEHIPKVADLRVTVVGERIFVVRITGEVLDWRSDYDRLQYQAIEAPTDLQEKMLAYLERFGLLFGCFDFAVTPEDQYVFLECNPNGQWAWLEQPTGLPMTAAFADLLEGL